MTVVFTTPTGLFEIVHHGDGSYSVRCAAGHTPHGDPTPWLSVAMFTAFYLDAVFAPHVHALEASA